MADVSSRSVHCCGMSDEEVQKTEKYAKETAIKAAVAAVFYPLAHVKTLFQLGHEPFPLSTGRRFGIGSEAYFLPNGLSYARSLLKNYGWSLLYNGVDAAIVANVVGNGTSFFTAMYLDRYFPEMGGKPVNLHKEEKDLSDSESARRALREAVRESTARIVGTIAARPFAVIMVRKVAQLIGGESKYTNIISSLIVIGREEGPQGYFSGLVPQIIAELITVWGIQALVYTIERGLQRAKVDDYSTEDKEAAQLAAATRKGFHLVVPFVVNSFAYPFSVVSTLMAVSGSGLAVAMLPYSPAFGSWHDAWSYLEIAQGLKRGARLFFREHTGAVTVGIDQQLYASTKHFV